MIVTIHQPDNLPYLGFFYKMSQADTFVVYDTAQFVKGRTHNRQRIRTPNGWTWLTIPVEDSLKSLRETRIHYDESARLPWPEHHWKVIESSYKKTPHFEEFSAGLKKLYLERRPETLAEWNIPIILYLKEVFGLRQKVVYFSELGISDELDASKKLAMATEKLGGNIYLSGPSGKHYLDHEPFRERGIEVQFSEFTHPEYPQYHSRFDNKFEQHIAAIDALFNLGKLPFNHRTSEVTPTLACLT